MDELEMWMYVAGELVLDVLDKLSSCPAAAARVPLIRLSGKLRSSPLLPWSGARALVSARIIPAVCQWRLHIQMRCHHRHHTQLVASGEQNRQERRGLGGSFGG